MSVNLLTGKPPGEGLRKDAFSLPDGLKNGWKRYMRVMKHGYDIRASHVDYGEED